MAFVSPEVVLKQWIAAVQDYSILAATAIMDIFTGPHYWADMFTQMDSIGVGSMPIIVLTGFFTGCVLALQSVTALQQFGAVSKTGSLVSLSMVKELGPVLTGLMVAGRVGAAIAAELGTMRVTEQIDALRTLATHPVDYLVVPRLVALHATLPLLTAESIAFGIFSGYIVGVYLLGIDPTYSWYNMLKYTATSDVVVGIIKAFIFGGIVAIVGCYKGMTCGEGAEGVGRATTEAVVYSSITILITNFFLTLILGKILHTI